MCIKNTTIFAMNSLYYIVCYWGSVRNRIATSILYRIKKNVYFVLLPLLSMVYSFSLYPFFPSYTGCFFSFLFILTVVVVAQNVVFGAAAFFFLCEAKPDIEYADTIDNIETTCIMYMNVYLVASFSLKMGDEANRNNGNARAFVHATMKKNKKN